MAISKLIFNGVTQMDVTGNTVATNNLLLNEVATGADGEQVIGAYVPSGGGSDTYSPKNDGKTHIWVRLLSDDCKTVYIRFSSSGGTVDWGDDSTSTIVAGNMSHTYSDLGLYDISFDAQIAAYSNIDYKYQGFIEALEIANYSGGTEMFDYCGGIKWAYYHNNTMAGSVATHYKNYHNYNLALQYCRLDPYLEYIGEYMFYYCQSLQSIEIPDTVTSIGDSAFSYCRALERVTIPEDVTSIGNSAFRYSVKLTEYHVKPQTPPTLGTNALQTPSGCVIYVPQGKLTTYQTATNWSAYASYMQEEPA